MPVMSEEAYHFLHTIHYADCQYKRESSTEPCFYRDQKGHATRMLSPCRSATVLAEKAGYNHNELCIAVLRYGTIEWP